jgi:hypothetical protein
MEQISSIVPVANQFAFQLRQVTVKAQSNEALFKLVEQAISRKPIQVIVTPRIDVAGYAYYWMGIRFDRQELDFKLKINEQIGKYILAYLKGDEPLPIVTEFEPSKKIENPEEWLREHEAHHSLSAITSKEELSMRDEVNYLTTKLMFMNGKIKYPSIKCEDVLSLLLA